MKDFFISYTGKDREWAEWIAWELESKGYSTVLQAWDFLSGSNFVLEMERASAKSERTIAVLSPEYVKSGFCRAEWADAFAKDPTGMTRSLIPVRVKKLELPRFLATIVYTDLVDMDESAATRALLAAVVGTRQVPVTAPGYPGAVLSKPLFPVGLPPIWNIPHLRNPNFTGREELLNQLEQDLNSGRSAALTQAIQGLGGVGKTELAAEYAYRQKDDYNTVWWVQSEEPAKLAADYARLASDLELPEKDAQDQSAVVEAVRYWLERNRGWLLIFDNAKNQKEIRDYVPRGETGHVIITSRDRQWAGVAKPFTVEVFEPDESVEFLVKRTNEQDRAAASELAEALGRLPLALEQAASYMTAKKKSAAQYLELYRKHERKILDRGEVSTAYSATVATTWKISFEQAEEDFRGSGDLLKLFAFLAPEDIPISLLTEGVELLPEPLSNIVKQELDFEEALAAVDRYSLMERRDETVSVHRLVLEVTRDGLNNDQKKTWAEAAVELVNQAFPQESQDVRTWDTCSRLMPHALTTSGHAEQLGVAPDATCRLLNQAGGYLRGRAEFAEAKSAYERALKIEMDSHDPDYTKIAIRLNNLGLVLMDLGDLEGAKEKFEQALKSDLKTFGPDHPNVAIRLNNLGGVLRALGDLEGAKEKYEQALKSDLKTFGPDHPNVATDLNNLGLVLEDLGDLDGSKEKYEEALEIFTKFLGEDHPNTRIVRQNLELLGK